MFPRPSFRFRVSLRDTGTANSSLHVLVKPPKRLLTLFFSGV